MSKKKVERKKDYLKYIFIIFAIILIAGGIFWVAKEKRIQAIYDEIYANGSGYDENGVYVEVSGDKLFTPDGYYNRANKLGDFALSGPQTFVIEGVKEIMDEITLGTPIEEVINMCGAPKEQKIHKLYTGYVFSILDGNASLRITSETKTGVVAEKSLVIFSRIDRGIKLSSEIGTEIEDLTKVIENVKEGMTLEEVEGFLGNKHLQIFDSKGYIKEYSWFDVLENRVDITFTEGKVSRITDVLGEDRLEFYE